MSRTKQRIWCSRAAEALLVAALGVGALAGAPIISSVTDNTTHWNVVPFPNQNDIANDQQTGQGDADIVGDSTNSGLYSNYDGTYLYYRVRLGDTLKQGYTGIFWLGIDADRNGSIDLFVGVNNQGSNHYLEFLAPGTGLNTGPSTTSIGNVLPQYQVLQDPLNYNYQSVSSTIQPGITNTDLNADGKTDSFLSFRIPFAGASGTATLQGAMQGIAGKLILETTPLSYLIATSTQVNSLNQDIGGLPKNYISTNTWIQLGGLTPPLNADGTPYTDVPEPGTGSLLLASAAAAWLAQRILQRRRSR